MNNFQSGAFKSLLSPNVKFMPRLSTNYANIQSFKVTFESFLLTALKSVLVTKELANKLEL